MINYLKYFCVNSIHYPSLVKDSYQISAFQIVLQYLCLPSHDNKPDCWRVEIAGAFLAGGRGQCFYTTIFFTLYPAVLGRGNSSRTSFVQMTRIGLKVIAAFRTY